MSRATYLILYEGRPEDPDAFLRYYLERHVPLLREFPRIRGIDVGVGRDDGDYFMIVRLLFDDLGDLRAAITSPERERARKDRLENFPPFRGRVHHQVVESVALDASDDPAAGGEQP